jgi:hypothetical protein
MNAVLHLNRLGDAKPEKAQASTQKRAHRYDSPEQERLAQRVLEKHKVALRNLAK